MSDTCACCGHRLRQEDKIASIVNVLDDYDKHSELTANLINLIGVESTAILIAKVGGLRVFIPNLCAPGSRIFKLVGDVKGAVLVKYYGGETLAIPNLGRVSKVIRNRGIIKDYQKDVKVQDLAFKHGITERAIYAVLRKDW